MPRKSKISQLPKELQDEINALLAAGHSYVEILTHVKALGVTDISHSGIGRHNQKMQLYARRYQNAMIMAEQLKDSMAGKENNEVLDGATDMLGGILMHMACTVAEGEKIELKPAEARDLGRTLESIAKAKRISLDSTAEKIKQQKAKQEEREEASEGGVKRIEIEFVKPKGKATPKPKASKAKTPQKKTKG